MDWPSFLFGAFMSCTLAFGVSAGALAFIMRRQAMGWMAVRAVALGLFALTFPPASPELFPEESTLWAVRLIGIDIAIAAVGPLLATYIEPTIDAPRLRRLMWSLLPLSLALACTAPFLTHNPAMIRIHDTGIFVLILILGYCLNAAIRKGSIIARYEAAAWAPAILVGFAGLYFDLIQHRQMPYLHEAMLVSFLLEFMITAAGLGFGVEMIRRELERTVVEMREATRMSTLDPLTGIANRRGLAQHFDDAAIGRPAGLALIDCDHFKRINDNFGHDIGDEVLVAVARAMANEHLFIGRLGGEEFVALIYGSDWEQLGEMARVRITAGVRSASPQIAFSVTASAGLAEVRADDTLETALKRADRALYAAKDGGRNRSLHERSLMADQRQVASLA